jgi:hypothetical protein
LQFRLRDSDDFSGLTLRDTCGIDKFFDSDNQMAFTSDLSRLFDPQVSADVPLPYYSGYAWHGPLSL